MSDSTKPSGPAMPLTSGNGNATAENKFDVLPDGELVLPSAFTDDHGRPRFGVPFPRGLWGTDAGVNIMVTAETDFGGFEAQTRRFFDAHIGLGDLFIDVGAHWGLFSLTVASRFRGQRPVIAIEADPFNVTRLMKSVHFNALAADIEIVPCAMGAKAGTAPLVGGLGTMGGSLGGEAFVAHPEAEAPPPMCSVPVMTIDALLAERPQFDRRVWLKVDVEGHELEVLEGASELIGSGRLAALMIEKGMTYSREPGASKFRAGLERLKAQGFALYRFADRMQPGPLIDYEFSGEDCDVLCLADGLQPMPWYG